MTWPSNPTGDMVPILEASVAVEAAKVRHPSSVTLTAADRCDACGAQAAYRVVRPDPARLMAGVPDNPTLDFCNHHWRKLFPAMLDEGWVVVGGNPEVIGDKP